jgi:hypothetical protein
MRLRITLASVLGATLAAVVISAWPTQRGTDPVAADHMQLVATVVASGKPIVTNSLDGSPIFNIANLQPGQSRSGQVTVKNAGSSPQIVGVWQSGLSSGPANRPSLAAWVQLAVYDGALNKNVYLGPYEDFPALQRAMLLCGFPTNTNSCPAWAEGETHVFTFTVTMPDASHGSGVDINSYQATWLQSEFDWASVN